MLERFGPATRDWFRGAFHAPTDAQKGAWEAISAGKHALVVAPTGSGKTLSAFLWAIDRVFHDKAAAPQSPSPSGRKKRTVPTPPPGAAGASPGASGRVGPAAGRGIRPARRVVLLRVRAVSRVAIYRVRVTGGPPLGGGRAPRFRPQ